MGLEEITEAIEQEAMRHLAMAKALRFAVPGRSSRSVLSMAFSIIWWGAQRDAHRIRHFVYCPIYRNVIYYTQTSKEAQYGRREDQQLPGLYRGAGAGAQEVYRAVCRDESPHDTGAP